MIAISTLVILYVLINFIRHIHNKLTIPTLLVLCIFSTALAEDLKHLGVASCASSNCHGSVTGLDKGNILQNEYVTWKRHDSHSKAWSVLTNSDSKIIGRHLGINNPETDPQCLSCHSTKAINKGEKFFTEDGVGCESCHGAASSWIKKHTEKNTNRDKNIELGMTDLLSPEKRSAICLNCHLGSNDSQVGHRLIGAGHPRLTFELETFSEIMPKHWRYDDDYRDRKSTYSPAQNWLVGQIERAIGSLELFSTSIKENVMPDFTFYNCYSCHHSLTEDQWKTRNYHGTPGKLKINTSSALIVSLALNNQDLKNKIEEMQNANSRKQLQNSIQSIIKTLKTCKSARIESDKAVNRIKNYAIEYPELQYELAEQILMAINVLSDRNSDEFKELYKSLENEESFNAKNFVIKLKQLKLTK